MVESVNGQLELTLFPSDDNPGVKQLVQVYLDSLVRACGRAGTGQDGSKKRAGKNLFCNHDPSVNPGGRGCQVA